MEELEEGIIEPLQPVEVKYHLDNPPPENRCGALSFNCRNEDCDYRFPDVDRESNLCPNCGSFRGVCGNFPRKGINNSGRCGWHGGNTGMGIMNHGFKGRSISKHIPTRLLQLGGIYSAEDKTRLLQFDEDVMILETRKIDLLHRLGESDTKQLWNNLNKEMRKYRKFQKEYAGGKTASGRKMLTAIDTIEQILVKGSLDYHIWDEITTLLEQQRKLKESELKRRKEQSTTITEDEARELITGILNIIKNRVRDQNVRNELMNDINAMLMVK